LTVFTTMMAPHRDDYGNGIDGADDDGVGVTQRRKNASSANRMSE